MPLHDTESWLIEASTTAESLPNPSTVVGRTHFLHNNSGAAQTWTATGGTLFSVNGVLQPTLVIPVGESREVYAHLVGPDWHVIPTTADATTKSFRAIGTTDASGNVTFNLTPAGFAAVPVCVASYGPLAASNAPVDVRLTAVSATSCTYNVRQAAAISVALIGLTVLVGSTNLAGVQVELIAMAAGSQA